MDQTDAIETLVSYLSARLTAPIRVSGMEDERPVPVILIEDWDTTDITHQTSAFAGLAVDADDGIEKQWFRFYYNLRIEFVVRHHDEVAAHNLLDSLRSVLMMVSERPAGFHDHLNALHMRGAGGIHHQFIESKETELHQAVVLESFHQVAESDGFGKIQSIVNNYTIEDIADDN